MPKFERCPWCGTEINDWFMEWYPQDEFDKIKNGDLPMDCPATACRRPVLMKKAKLYKANIDAKAAVRSIERAQAWLKVTHSPWPTLEDFLTDPSEQDRTKYFRSGYWPTINV
jgi:hypothetical protein